MKQLILAAAAATAALVITASAQTPPTPPTPTMLELPSAIRPTGIAVYLEVPATGVQIYTCGKNQTGAFAWIFKAPEAQLFDTHKAPLGKHYAGPTWEGLDGGKVVGAVKASTAAPVATAIPWLLLDVKSSEGSGMFTQAKGILRIATAGGVAPAQGCAEAQSGSENRVPYTATYLFLK